MEYHTETHVQTPTWIEVKEKLRMRFSNLTEADLNYPETKLDEMLSNMQVKLAKTKVQLKFIISMD